MYVHMQRIDTHLARYEISCKNLFSSVISSVTVIQIKTKLMLSIPLFIIHVRAKFFLKVLLDYKNEAPLLQKWAWHMHSKTVHCQMLFRVSVQINEVLLYNKK